MVRNIETLFHITVFHASWFFVLHFPTRIHSSKTHSKLCFRRNHPKSTNSKTLPNLSKTTTVTKIGEPNNSRREQTLCPWWTRWTWCASEFCSSWPDAKPWRTSTSWVTIVTYCSSLANEDFRKNPTENSFTINRTPIFLYLF